MNILYCSSTIALGCKGAKLYIKKSIENDWKFVGMPRQTPIERVLFLSSLLRRLFRLGFSFGCIVNERYAVLLFGKRIIWLDYKDRRCVQDDIIHGESKPLSLAVRDGKVFYGEYNLRKGKGHALIWGADVNERKWRQTATIENVRHIHGIYHDLYSDTFWVSTGDTDDESLLLRYSPDFKICEKILSGSQQTRLVQPLFGKDDIVFGTDAPDDKNYVYRLCRKSGSLSRGPVLVGPVYYGITVGGLYILSTVVEPSTENLATHVELLVSCDGDIWYLLEKFEKDSLSMKYFQYGLLRFPSGQGNGIAFTVCEVATKGDGISHSFSVSDVVASIDSGTLVRVGAHP